MKTVLITGSSSGYGRATALHFLERGWNVVATMRSPERVEGLALSERSERLRSLRLDVTDRASIAGAIREGIAAFGGLDVLVNNAGSLVARRKLEEVDLEFWDEVIRINLTTMMFVTRTAVPALVKAGASSIVNIASLAGRKGGHGGSLVYSSAKGAMITWTRALAAELGPRGVRVNCVAPGLILGTRFHDTHTTKESAEETVRGIPLGRGGNAEDIARPVVYLASEYDGFITGATLDINGGVYSA
jgi:3-oxoacyl-[acyl-carrier protein] reductase